MIVMNDSVKRHRGARTCAAVWLGMTLTAVTSVAQGQLPDGPGKNTTKKVCGQCHSAEVVVGKGKTKEEWGQTVGEMASFGAEGTEEEFDEIVDYLAKNFPKSAASNKIKINVNKATAKDLEPALELSTKEAQAIVQYREQNGAFKSLEELKKVPGLDAKKVEAKKERLIF